MTSLQVLMLFAEAACGVSFALKLRIVLDSNRRTLADIVTRCLILACIVGLAAMAATL